MFLSKSEQEIIIQLDWIIQEVEEIRKAAAIFGHKGLSDHMSHIWHRLTAQRNIMNDLIDQIKSRITDDTL